MKGKTMINKLRSTLINTTIKEDDQQFITNIAILLRAITIYLLPILIGLFVWNYLFSDISSKAGIYYALHLLIGEIYQLCLTVFCLSIIIDILFTIFTIILIYRKKNQHEV